jgi:hypothetical protein
MFSVALWRPAMIKLGARKIERVRFISSDGEEDKVEKWCKRTGYLLIDKQPVHRILLQQYGKCPKGNSWDIIEGFGLFTAERPIQKRKGKS